MARSNSTPRIYPPDPATKTRRINYDPVLKLYYYKVTESQIRDHKQIFAGIYGGTGVLTPNSDKSFVTPVWNFSVVSSNTSFLKPLTRAIRTEGLSLYTLLKLLGTKLLQLLLGEIVTWYMCFVFVFVFLMKLIWVMRCLS